MSRALSRFLGGFAAAAFTILSTHGAWSAPKAELWPRWGDHDPNSRAVIDHGKWRRFLAAYLIAGTDGVNRLRYGDVDAAGRRTLDDYIETLAATPILAYRRDEQLAYWINLYNALTVRVVLEHYPVSSILDIDISPGLFAQGPWGKKLIAVDGQALSLDDIEHRILRPIWRDPRIHYAVNCASVGCPDLAAEPYRGATADAQLSAAARGYVNGGRGAKFDGGALYLSSIYKWYVGDFGGTDRSVIAHLARYAAPALAARLSGADEVAGHFYDWSLNDARPAR